MNIFYVDPDPFVAAQSLGDKHVLKMLLESVQLLSNVYHMEVSGQPAPANAAGNPYRKSHYNHPCSIWTRSDIKHWNWLLNHASGLYAEYIHRWPGKTHACLGPISYMIAWPPYWLFNADWQDPPQCMPDEYKHSDTVTAYRRYYNEAKTHLHKWTRRTPPAWASAPASGLMRAV